MEKDNRKIKISLKPAKGLIEMLLIVLGVVMVWRGLWNLLDTYLFPENELLSNVISIAIGLFLIYLPDRDLKNLT